jgi:hypothetical protein
LHTLDGLFGCDERFDNLVLLKVDATDHLIPTRGEKHVISGGDTPHRDGIGKLKD